MKQAERLQEQMRAENRPISEKSGERYTRIPIPETPFWIIGNNEEGYVITIQNYSLCEKRITQEDIKHYTQHISNLLENTEQTLIHAAQTWLNIHQWEVICVLVLCMNDIVKKNKDNMTEAKK